MKSIGEFNERSLHRSLKERYAVVGSATEQAIEGFVVDAVNGGHIVEVQTGSFWPLRNKLQRLLNAYSVTLVHPVARDRYIVNVAVDRTMPATRRRSPRHGSVFDVFSSLVSIPAMLAHPNLTLDVVLTVEEELRALSDRPGRWRRGWACVDRRLVDVVETPHHRLDGRPVRHDRRRAPRTVHEQRHRGGDEVRPETRPKGCVLLSRGRR